MIDCLSVDDREWIEDVLDRLDMVAWDRFTVADDENIGTIVEPYGWIERDGDDYKDFAVVRFFPDTDDNLVGFTTSSQRFSEEIYRRIYEGDADTHNECKRVENHFDVPNAIRGQDASLADFSGGEAADD